MKLLATLHLYHACATAHMLLSATEGSLDSMHGSVFLCYQLIGFYLKVKSLQLWQLSCSYVATYAIPNEPIDVALMCQILF